MRLPLASILAVAAGCSATPRPPAVPTMRPAFDRLTPPTVDPLLHAAVDPPLGWRPDPVKASETHRHQVWISPGKATAYGVISFKMPLPVGDNIALWGVLREMRAHEGEATLIERHDDPGLPGIRFTAEGGRYRVRGNLTTDGLRGWVVYAGTLRAKPIDAAELRLAEQARDATRVDLP